MNWKDYLETDLTDNKSQTISSLPTTLMNNSNHFDMQIILVE